jgi:hypothetical protein
VHDWPATAPAGIPSPRLAGAWAKLDMLPAERVPLWAAHWLAAGNDGDGLRALAGLRPKDDPRDIHDLVPEALADCGVTFPDSAAAAAQVAFTHLARLYGNGLAAERWILGKIHEIVVRSGYADSVMSLPLGKISGLDDEWGAGWGRTEPELKAEVRAACAAQLAASSM